MSDALRRIHRALGTFVPLDDLATPRDRVALATVLLLAALTTGAVTPPALAAQSANLRQEIQESQRRLEQVRVERARLEAEMRDARNRIQNTAADLANVERRLSASRSVLAEVQFQSDATAEQIHATQTDLLRSKDRLSESQAVLNRRLREIYKMGPLQTVQVLLGARSFSDFLNRYRYLQQIATYDRALVQRVTTLESDLARQADELDDRMSLLGTLRQDRLTEVAQLQSVEVEHQTAIRQYRAREASTASRIGELEADEGRLTNVIDDLETRRREMEAARATTAGPSISAADAGTLDWPLDGDVIYGFGRQRQPNGIVLRWNGLGIRSRVGEPVRAVKAGRVVLAGPFEGYGPTVVLSHGDGFYTLYLYLQEIGVVEGRDVTAGQVVGTVGGADTPEGPHLEFQIRAPLAGSSPQAQDPRLWLRPRGAP